MSGQSESLSLLCDIFETREVHIGVIYMSATHGHLELYVGYPERQLSCGGCFFFCGALHGGPYQVEVSTACTPEGLEYIELNGNGGEFVARITRAVEVPVRSHCITLE